MVEHKYDTIFSLLLSQQLHLNLVEERSFVAHNINRTVMLEATGNVDMAVYSLDASQRLDLLYLTFDIFAPKNL